MAQRKVTLQQMREVTDIVGLNCDSCGADVPQVWSDSPNGVHMLRLSLHGGYGEFIDGSANAELCEKCANLLLEAFPILSKLIGEASR